MTSNSDIIKYLRQTILKCGICSEEYKSPRLLPCAHIFCEPCLSDWIKQAVQELRQYFECPLCRQQHNLPKTTVLEEWPQPHFLSSVQDIVAKSQQKSSSCTNCQRYEKQTSAKWICKICRESYCDECQTQHLVLNNDHKVLALRVKTCSPKSDISKTTTSQDECAKYFCNKHLATGVQFFCKDCKIMCCRNCALKDHKLHEYSEISKVAADYRNLLRARELDMDDAERKLHKIQSLLKNSIDNIAVGTNKLKASIDNRAEYIIKEVERQRNELHSQLQEETTNLRDKLNSQLETATNHLSALDNYRQQFSIHQDESVITTYVLLVSNIDLELKNMRKLRMEEFMLDTQFQLYDNGSEINELLGKVVINNRPQSKGDQIRAGDSSTANSYGNTGEAMLGKKLAKLRVTDRTIKLNRTSRTILENVSEYFYGIICTDQTELIMERFKSGKLAIDVYGNDGKIKSSIPVTGENAYTLAYKDNRIYRPNTLLGKIDVYNKESGELIKHIDIASPGKINNICICSDTLYVTSTTKNCVFKINLTDKHHQVQLLTNDKLKRPNYISATDVTIVVTCTDFRKIFVLNNNGTMRCVHYPNEKSALWSPSGVVIDDKENILVADTRGHKITIFSPFGYLANIKVNSPVALALDKNKTLYIRHASVMFGWIEKQSKLSAIDYKEQNYLHNLSSH